MRNGLQVPKRHLASAFDPRFRLRGVVVLEPAIRIGHGRAVQGFNNNGILAGGGIRQ